MDQSIFHTLTFHDSEALISPQFGCNVVSLILNKQQILDGNTDLEKLKQDHMCKGDFLAPFPNRVCDGKYTFQGTQYQLEQNEQARGHALHGFLMKKQCDLISSEQTDEYSRSVFSTTIHSTEFKGYPFDVEITLSFTLKEAELTIEMGGTNKGRTDAPFGMGWHPYLTAGKRIDECGLLIPAESTLETDDTKELIPTGKHLPNSFGTFMRPIGTYTFDTCFVDLDGTAVRFEDRELFFDESMKYLQIYTPEERNSIAVEPMTCAPDAFNNGFGLITLVPGETIKRSFGIRFIAPFGSRV